MKGYWNRPDATAAVLRDGWFYTGDLGYFDAEHNLFLTGRKKEILVLSNGKNIYPEEVEAHYLKSPYIKELAIIGIEGRAGEGDRLHAVIVPNFDALRQKKIVNAKEVIRFDIESLSQQIPSTKRIGSYEIWQEDLPRTTTRKIKRFEVEKSVKTNAARKVADKRVPSERPLMLEEAAWLDRPDVQRALKIIRDAARLASRLTPAQARARPRPRLHAAHGTAEPNRGGTRRQCRRVATRRDLHRSRSSRRRFTKRGQRRKRAGKRPSPDGKQFWQNNPIPRSSPSSEFAAPQRHILVLTFAPDSGRCARPLSFRMTRHREVAEDRRVHSSSNHQSYLDRSMLASVLPGEVFSKFSPWARATFSVRDSCAGWRVSAIIVVDPDANLFPAMRASAFGLRQGRPLILYPEGERSIDGTPKTFQEGRSHFVDQSASAHCSGSDRRILRSLAAKQILSRIQAAAHRIRRSHRSSARNEASEEAYETLTANLKNRIVGMWQALRNTDRNEQ